MKEALRFIAATTKPWGVSNFGLVMYCPKRKSKQGFNPGVISEVILGAKVNSFDLWVFCDS